MPDSCRHCAGSRADTNATQQTNHTARCITRPICPAAAADFEGHQHGAQPQRISRRNSRRRYITPRASAVVPQHSVVSSASCFQYNTLDTSHRHHALTATLHAKLPANARLCPHRCRVPTPTQNAPERTSGLSCSRRAHRGAGPM